MKIGFFVYTSFDWDDNSEVMGGAETWVERTSKFLSLSGNDVTVYGYPFGEHTTEFGVRYKSFEDYDEEEYDIAIVNRFCRMFWKINSKHVFLMAHEGMVYDFNEKIYNSPKFAGIGVLSEWQKGNLKGYFPFIEDDKFFFFKNGIDEGLYDSIIEEKENAMVWSSCYERGMHFFKDKVLPLIKKEVPDFKVYACSYNDIPNECISEDITYLGRLNKTELSNFQKKCKIWIYPNLGKTFHGEPLFETFCISAVENAMAGNAIITNNGGGLSSTLEGYSELINFDEIDKIGEEKYAEVLANKAIEYLTNDDKRNDAAKWLRGKFDRYTWAHTTDEFISEIKKLYFARVGKFIIFNNPIHFFGIESFSCKWLFKQIGYWGVGRVCCINSNNGDRYHDKNNEHHYTTTFHYKTVFPQLSALLGLKADLEDDFNKVEYFKDGEDYSFVYPKKDKWFELTYPKYHSFNNGYFKCDILKKGGFYSVLYGENLNMEPININYHKLFSLAHYPCVIENKGENNGKTLLINGDSHMIPLLPVLCYYYKKIVYLDNRLNISFRHFWRNVDFDDVLFEMQDFGNNSVNRYLIDNFR